MFFVVLRNTINKAELHTNLKITISYEYPSIF